MPGVAPSVPTLYHVRGYCSSIPAQVASELELDSSVFDIHLITDSFLKTDADFGTVSPRRVVPVLTFPDGSTMLESGAILLHMLETYDISHKLHPAPGEQSRTKFLQGVFYGVTECFKAVANLVMETFIKEKKDQDEKKVGMLKEKYNKVVVQHLTSQLNNGKAEYYLGTEFSAADIVFGFMLSTADFLKLGLLENDVLKAYFGRLAKRDSFKEVYEVGETQ